MNVLLLLVLLFGIWLAVDAAAGIWQTRNLFFAWQFVGISLTRLPLESFFYAEAEVVPMWSLLLGLLGTCGLLLGLVAAIVSLLTGANAISHYIQTKQERSFWAWLFCHYEIVAEKQPVL
jgi:hypothetical protein